jgi:uncharacterized protein (TIGR04255 family)
MAFPDAKRVVYEKNPLEAVICQLRFPPILKIEAESPAAFQERIRAQYPLYAAKSALLLPAALPADVAALIAQGVPFGGGHNTHEFTSKDETWVLSLTRGFLALTCRSYERWESFKERLQIALVALQDVYAPAFFTRIGLRYRNVLRRSTPGLEGVGWADLLQPWMAGAFASLEAAGDIEHSAHQLLIRLPDGRSRAQVNHGLVQDGVTGEVCYVIDTDFFDGQQSEPQHALERLDFLNRQSGLFFRWCIQDRLHDAMRPRPLSGH